ncbi:hypothetical protein HDU78_011216 [Chytriomyces hyalinus]|nr:hypothetical protein HDU78_011216 [Chytriomyces hyalinus]
MHIPQDDQEVDAPWNDPHDDDNDNHYRISRLSTWSASSDDTSAYRFRPHQSNTCMFIRADSLRPFNSYSLEAPGRSATLTYGPLSIAITSSNSADIKKEAEKPPRTSLSMLNQLWRRKSKAQLLSATPLPPLSPPSPPQPVSIKTMLLRTISRFKFGAAAAEKDMSGQLKDRGGLSTTITSVFHVSKT